MRLLVRFKLLGVPQTLFPLLKGELKGEEALEGPKSASPEGRIIAVCRGLLADMPSNGKEKSNAIYYFTCDSSTTNSILTISPKSTLYS